MGVEELISQLGQAGIRLEVKDSKLRVHAPFGVMTDALSSEIKLNREGLIALLEKMRNSDEASKHWRIPLRAQNQIIPASHAQQRMWFIDRLEGGSSQFNMLNHFTFQGNFDVGVFKRVLHRVLERHESLRTCFKEVDGQAIQLIQTHYEVPIQHFDLSTLPEAAQQVEIERHIQIENTTPFDLEKDVLMRARVLMLSDNAHKVMFNVHHITSDGWSLRVLRYELDMLYKAYSGNQENPLPPLPIQYADYACWQREWLQGEILKAQYDYWVERLRDIPQVHNLPLDKPRPLEQRFKGRLHRQILDERLTNAVRALCHKFDVTLFMGLQTAFSILLHRYSNDTDIVMGTPIAGRTHAELEPLIGLFINTLVLRTDLSGNPTFSALLQRNKQNILNAFAHQHIPFELLLTDKLKPTRSLSYNPVFQIMFTQRQNEHGPEAKYEYSLNINQYNEISIKFDFDLDIVELKDGLVLNWQYNTDLFEDDTIRRMAANFAALLNSISVTPGKNIAALDLLSDEEKHRMLTLWNGESPPCENKCLHHIFESYVQQQPDVSAVIFAGEPISYLKLNIAANRLARHLLEFNIGPETLIAVCVDRCPERIMAVLAVLKAGAAYVPIDPAYPKSRIAHMLSDSGAEIVLTQTKLAPALPAVCDHVVCLDDEALQIKLAQYDTGNLKMPDLTNMHLAQLIYTSGSTGAPKGVMLAHRNLVSYLSVAIPHYGVPRDSRVPALSSMSFDIFTEELCLSIFSGGTLYLSPEGITQSVDVFWAFIKQHQINCLTLPTAYWSVLCAELNQSHAEIARQYLSVCIVGGEELPVAHLQLWQQRVGTNVLLWNSYGPTETTVIACLAEISRLPAGVPVTIGTRLANSCLYVLHPEHGFLQPVGAPGELCIGGQGVARGYWQLTELSEERFISNPFSADPAARLYRTGDWVRYLGDGRLEFLGRVDGQVKIRGFRVEPGEIESHLRRYPGVKDAVVLATAEQGQAKQLVAYLVVEGEFEQVRLKAALHERLPDYMVPALFIPLDALPLTHNGKLDREALPKPDERYLEKSNYVAPRNALEEKFCDIWQALLAVKRVGIHDNFFELGGHSLLATRMISQLRQALNLEISLRDLFKHPTIAELAQINAPPNAYKSSPIVAVPRRARTPLSYAQQRVWFSYYLKNSKGHNLTLPFSWEGELHLDACKQALLSILERHDVLRSIFIRMQGEIYQTVQQAFDLPFAQSDLHHLDEPVTNQQLEDWRRQESDRPFDLSKDFPLRVHLFRLNEQRQQILITLHLIAGDAHALLLLRDEFLILYKAYAGRQPDPLASVQIQYADYIHWQRLQSKALDQARHYWRERLHNLPPVHKLPLDQSRSTALLNLSGHYATSLDQSLVQALVALCDRAQVDLFVLLHAAFSVLLGRYSQCNDIVMGTPVTGRDHPQLQSLVGLCADTRLLRCDIGGNLSFIELLEQNKQQLEMDAGQPMLPFILLLDTLKPERSTHYHPLFQILFSLRKADEPLPEADLHGRLDLSLHIIKQLDTLQLCWHYNSELFFSQTIEQLNSRFAVLLQAVVADPYAEVQALDMLSFEDKQVLRQQVSSEPANNRCLHRKFEQQVQQTPDADALQMGQHRLSYRELNEAANRLAHYLISQELRPGMLVAICLDACIETVIAVWGVLKAGGACVPLPLKNKLERQPLAADEICIPFIIARQCNRLRLPLRMAKPVYLDAPGLHIQLDKCAVADPEVAGITASDSAFVFYDLHGDPSAPGMVLEHRHIPLTLPAETTPRSQSLLIENFEYLLQGLGRQAQGMSLELSVTVRPQARVKKGNHAPLAALPLSPVLLTEQNDILLGQPQPYFHTYILDNAGEPLPQGAVGELCIGGMVGSYVSADEIRSRHDALYARLMEKQLNYWLNKLPRSAPVYDLPFGCASSEKIFSFAECHQALTMDLSVKVNTICGEFHVNVFTFFYTIFTVLIKRYTQANDIVVGTPKTTAVYEATHLLPLCSDLDGNPPLSSLLAQHEMHIAEAFAHQYGPMDNLVEVVRQHLGLDYSDLIRLRFAYYSADVQAAIGEGDSSDTADFDLQLLVTETDNGFNCEWRYPVEKFCHATISRLAANFIRLTESATMHAAHPILDLPLLSEQEQTLILQHSRPEARILPHEDCVHALIEQQALHTPGSDAIAWSDGFLSYSQLNIQANRLAHYLIEQGVTPGDFVALYMGRNAGTIIALLAILKTGGVYLPLDPEYPATRLAYMLADSNARFVITQMDLQDLLPEGDYWQYCYDAPELQTLLQHYAEHNPDIREDLLNASSLAYVIYTSGSTGQPKGVMIEHRSLVNLGTHFNALLGTADAAARGQPVRWACNAAFSFDAALQAISQLMYGACLILIPEAIRREIPQLAVFIQESDITVMDCTPAQLKLLLETAAIEKNLPALIIGGESIGSRLWQKLVELHQTTGLKAYNAYGPTEACVDTTLCAITTAQPHERIGTYVNNYYGYVLQAGQIAPFGVPGELYVGGVGVARGYLNRPELNCERFVEDPFTPGKRLYKTGDWVRLHADGALEFIGRVDHQVKIRGYRIELGEIEHVLQQDSRIKEAVVLARTDDGMDKRLVAYVLPNAGFTADQLGALKQDISRKIPVYMMPSVFVLMQSFPLTANNKVDRKALPAPRDEDFIKAPYTAPSSHIEVCLSEIWRTLLKVERIGVYDNFFELGGHSLLATQLISRIRMRLHVELLLRDIFEQPTIAGLQQLIAGRETSNQVASIARVAREEKLLLSYAQQRLWFIDKLEGGSSQYNLPLQINLQGPLSLEHLKAVLEHLLQRHEVLRTTYVEVEGEVYQCLHDKPELPLACIDLRRYTAHEQSAQIERVLSEAFAIPFQLAHELPLRIYLLSLAVEHHILWFNLHHIAMDGWSIGILRREFNTLYVQDRIENSLPPLRVQYADYAHWQRQWLQGHTLQQQLDYWRVQLAEIPQVHTLPLDQPRPAQQRFKGEHYHQQIENTLLQGMQKFCRHAQVSLFMLLQTAFSVLLGRYSNTSDVVMGTPIAGRTHEDLELIIGFFANTLVLRTDLSGNPSFIELLRKNKQNILDAYTHQHLPFEMLVDELKPERSLSYNPIVQIMFVLQNRLEGDENASSQAEDSHAKFDLTLNIDPAQDSLLLTWTYSSDLFLRKSIERLAGSFLNLLRDIVIEPERSVRQLKLLTDAQQQELLKLGRHRSRVARQDTIVTVFEKQAASLPDRIALEYAEHYLSYSELNQRSNQLAHYLIEQGVKPEDLVVVCMERSLEMMIAILAILKAGGAYVPVDPTYPADRIAYMLEDTGTRVVIGQSATLLNLSLSSQFCVRLDDAKQLQKLQSYAEHNPAIDIEPWRLCYVIYTSGSTGQPNGVMVEHDSVVRLVIDCDYVPLQQESRLLQVSSVSFDAATFEIWGSLLNGATLVLYPQAIPDIDSLNQVLLNRRINILWLTSGLFEQWSERLPALKDLQWVLSGGDVLNPQAVRRVYDALPQVTVVNGYGPTENTTFSSCYRVPKDVSVDRGLPVGTAINGSALYVLDQNKALVPMGAIGELYTGGRGVARGYLNRVQLSQERFIGNPFSTNDRIYKTGDWVRWNINGELEFIGRVDNQVKIRGFRIELGEVEQQLLKHKEMKEAVVLVHQDQGMDKRLVAYIVPVTKLNDQQFLVLKQTVAERIPAYMLPSIFIMLDAFPLTHNGKINRKALPAPREEDFSKMEYVAPRNEVEADLCEIWQNTLKLQQVGIHDNFFDLGGHSLLAVRLLSQIRSRLQVELQMRDLFAQPTIAGLSQRLQSNQQETILPPIEPAKRTSKLPLSYAQQRLWFIDQLEGGSSQYNIPTQVKLQEALDVQCLEAALYNLMQRHEVLRTTYAQIQGEPYQVIHSDPAVPFLHIDLSDYPPTERTAQLERYIVADAATPFKLDKELPLRAQLLTLTEHEHVLLLNLHHIASDGWSMDVMQRELEHFYQAALQDTAPTLPMLRVQYADYAIWQRQWLRGDILQQQLDYWRVRLHAAPAVHSLPLDKVRPKEQRFQGKSRRLAIDASLSEKIRQFCRHQKITVFIFMQTIFSMLLSRHSQANDIVMGTPLAGRTHADTEALIGFFVNTLVLRCTLGATQKFTDLLHTHARQVLDDFSYQHIPFEMVVDELKPERSLSYTPLFQIMFTSSKLEQQTLASYGGEQEQPRSVYSKFDLNLAVLELDDGFVTSWQYNSDLFYDATVKRMANDFTYLLSFIMAQPDASVEQCCAHIGSRKVPEKFIRNPYSSDPQAVLYRSGVFARWRADGLLEFVSQKTVNETAGQQETILEAPRDLLEKELCEAWKKLFNIEDIGIQTNFFDLGGDSFLALHLLDQIEHKLHRKIDFKTIFEHPTILDLAEHMRRYPHVLDTPHMLAAHDIDEGEL